MNQKAFGGISNLCHKGLWDTKECKMWFLPARNLYSVGEESWCIICEETGLVSLSLWAMCENPDHDFMVPLSEQYPIMCNHLMLETDNSEFPIMQ